jgi:hypothetical protein
MREALRQRCRGVESGGGKMASIFSPYYYRLPRMGLHECCRGPTTGIDSDRITVNKVSRKGAKAQSECQT